MDVVLFEKKEARKIEGRRHKEIGVTLNGTDQACVFDIFTLVAYSYASFTGLVFSRMGFLSFALFIGLSCRWGKSTSLNCGHQHSCCSSRK
jgi:hypothetical protein